MNYAGRVLPRWLLTGSIGWIAGFGQAGSAVFPFITGAIASKTGIKALQPLYAPCPFFSVSLLTQFRPQVDIHDVFNGYSLGPCSRGAAPSGLSANIVAPHRIKP